jgi:putative ABC transport system permease protein
LIVLTTTLAGVRERRGEIGIFRSIGYRRKHIFKVILIENLAVALAGSGLGIALASLVAGTMARALAQVQTVLAPSPLILGLSLVLSLLVVLAASAYPAARAAQLSPTLAMRRV